MPTLAAFAKWKSVTEASEELGVARQTVLTWGQKKKLRGVETSIGWLFDPKDVQRIKDERSKHNAP